jgi:N-acetylmuramoyl-L-alanine amidase
MTGRLAVCLTLGSVLVAAAPALAQHGGAMDVALALKTRPVLSVVLDTPGRMEQLTSELELSAGEVDALWQIAAQERQSDRDLHRSDLDPEAWNAEVATMAAASDAEFVDLLGERHTVFVDLLQVWFDEDAARAGANPPPDDGARSCLTYSVYGTQYDAATSWEVAVPDKYAKFAALGWSNAAGYPGSDYEVELVLDGITNTVPVGDVGPWNIDDNYWNDLSGDRPRRMWTDLAQGYPEAAAAYYDNYNGGQDQYGRSVSNPAGIDQCLTLAGAMGLAYLENAWLTVTYLWECDGNNNGGTPQDNDGDGYSPADGDCDDNNPHVYPGAVEVVDGYDNDCDNHVDNVGGGNNGNNGAPEPAIASICIDAGHGDFDPGAVGNGLNEKDVNLDTALAFRAWLEADNLDTYGGASWDVHMTRDSDVFVSLSARADYANSLGVDYFMSIHANAGGGNGTETFAYAAGTTASSLATQVNDAVVAALGTYDRGTKVASFTVLTQTAMPAELHELAFLDVWAGNAEILADGDNLEDAGRGHLHAVQKMMGISPYTPVGFVPYTGSEDDGSGPPGPPGAGGPGEAGSGCAVDRGSSTAPLTVVLVLLVALAFMRRRA